jgi:hypothetical protein
MTRLAVAAVALAALAGCGGSDRPPVPEQTDGEVIRGWLAALNAGDYVAAGSYFADDALVDQGDPVRLRSREDAELFNRSLPCRGELTDTKDEGKTTLAAFRLSAGPGGPCSGRARVRFTVERGKFEVFRQLPETESGPVV